MAAKGTTRAETDQRVRTFAEIIAAGGRRSDCIRHGQEHWGVAVDTCDKYLALARDQLRSDWDVQRPQMVADLLSQCATLQQEAREKGQLHIALGAINTAAKLAQICS
ncbi:MAG: Prochlorococcus phage [Pseudomonadota bacterium]|jgi:hypothetical protein